MNKIVIESGGHRQEITLNEKEEKRARDYIVKLMAPKKEKVKKEKTHKNVCSNCGSSEKPIKVPI